MDDIQQTRHIQSVNKQHAYQNPKVRTSDLHGCYRCGKSHDRSDRCPAADSACRYCNTTGHWACVCLKQKRDQDRGARPKQQPQYMSKTSTTERRRSMFFITMKTATKKMTTLCMIPSKQHRVRNDIQGKNQVPSNCEHQNGGTSRKYTCEM